MNLYVRTQAPLCGAYDLREACLDDYRKAIPDEIKLELAKELLEGQIRQSGPLTNPELMKTYICTHLSCKEREHMLVLFFDSALRLIKSEVMFKGTIDAASVYPREIVKRALELNTASCVLAHNHPSQHSCEPSNADRRVTRKIADALETVDIKLTDHIVVAGSNTCSFAERGFL
ncbi:RadC family protein [Vibrio maritimus]|uniref:RadC family protein n=1 Tax=Vibrio maritimus TaxID=990268 RepID=UPI0040685941